MKVILGPDDEPNGSRGWFYGEDVFRFLHKTPWGMVDIAEIDKLGTQFTITAVKHDNRRRLIRWLDEEAERHHLKVEFPEQ